jgi:histidinol-phosphatase (PHP family)
LREAYQPRLQIGLGIEVDYQPHLIEETVAYLSRHAFDVVLLSVHWAGDRPLHLPRLWRADNPAGMTAAYQKALSSALAVLTELGEQGERPFDILAHFDLCARYEHSMWGEVATLDAGWLDASLAQLLAAEVVPEINTSGLRQGLGRTMPDTAALQRYHALGGRYVSIGSDAHQARHIGADFAAVAASLIGLGFQGETVYQGRVPTIIPFSATS